MTYGFLSLSLIALWLPAKETKRFSIRLWHIFCIAALGCGLLFGNVQLSGLFAIAILGISCYCAASELYTKSVRIIAGTVMLVLSVGLSLHVVPGFSNPKVVANIILSKGGIPYSKYLNFDKIFVGLFVLGFTCKNLLSTPQAWKRMLKQAAPISGTIIIVLLFMSFVLGYVRLEPKWSAIFWFWAWTNLLFTCIAEEALYRGIIQRFLIAGLAKYRYGATVGLVLAAVLFGLMHYPGGIKYVLLSTVAGIGYGWTYLRTQQIEASILTHFLLNLLHFVFFTYPALAIAMG
ncbi:MAG: CPBP family intramembrane metalloprotease [Candidatus Electrothrix sp. AR4]|nr:CPBP family intramembrane metalloprotease [Candidatus Electrothrix sp. AR4]